MIKTLYYLWKKVSFKIYIKICNVLVRIHFKILNVKHGKFTFVGLPNIDVQPTGKLEIGSGLAMVSKDKYATLGKNNRCKIIVYNEAELKIGNNVGISNSTIVSTLSITIGNNVMIGGGVIIVDSDFHSLNPAHWHTAFDSENMQKAKVSIGDNVFIGMNSIILKGVTIGSDVVIAAGSIITRDIPSNQIWGGNPGKFIKSKALH